MADYRVVQVKLKSSEFPAIVFVSQKTDEGFQMYCSAGWMRRSQEWLDVYSVPTDDDVPVQGLIDELRGRGMELTKEEVQNVR